MSSEDDGLVRGDRGGIEDDDEAGPLLAVGRDMLV